MHEYDVTLKSVLRRLTGSVLLELTGRRVRRWHNTELPSVQSRRADMLGETADGTLVHIELQSTNQTDMALRMLEYALAIQRRFGRFPEQIVLYVGSARLRMRSTVTSAQLDYRCRFADIRELDGDRLIESSRVEDNVIAVLARLRDEREAVRSILRGISGCGPARRARVFEELMLLAGLRKLEPVIEREAKQMPILNDIMDHSVLGRERKRGIELGIEKGLVRGRKEGRQEGRQEGMEQGERLIVLRMIDRRFGPVPDAARKKIEGLPPSKLERIALRLLESESLEDLLR